MNKQLQTLALIGLIVTSIALSGGTVLARAQRDPELSFDGLLYRADKVGEKFNVTVDLSFAEASMRIVGVQFRVTYDPNMVEALSASEGSFLSQFNNTAAPPYTFFTSSVDVDAVYGPSVLVGILVLPNQTGIWTNFPAGAGSLATITFKALYRPMEPDTVTMPLTLVNTLITDDNMSDVSHTIIDATYKPTPITRPTLTIVPATYTASLIGETFNTTVNINNLDPDALSFGQRLVGVMFRVQYDSTLLKPLALYEGTFLKQFNNTASPPYTFITYSFDDDPIYGRNVLVGVLILPNESGMWNNFPVGSGTLSAITFEAIAQPGQPQPAVSSALTLTDDTQLINDTLDDIPHTAQSGQYQILPLSFTVEPADLFAQQRVTLTTQLPAYPITYNWNFGDGTIRSEQGSGTGTGTTSVNHIYASAGTYDITLTCTVGDAVSGVFTSSSATHTAIVLANNEPTIDIVIDSGSVYFRGETAEFSILTTNNGGPIDTTKMEALLYHGSSLLTNLTTLVQTVATGLYRVAYSVPADADFGTYTLLVKAEYYNARGTGTKAFQISQTLTTTTATITQIENDVATIQTDLETIEVNLTAINASISGLIVDAKGTLQAQITSSMGTLTARLDVINATVTAINGNTVTISTTLGDVSTTLGNVQTKLGDLQTTETTVQPLIYAATAFSLIAMILAAIILLRGRKK